jgi:hypothetical protein
MQGHAEVGTAAEGGTRAKVRFRCGRHQLGGRSIGKVGTVTECGTTWALLVPVVSLRSRLKAVVRILTLAERAPDPHATSGAASFKSDSGSAESDPDNMWVIM